MNIIVLEHPRMYSEKHFNDIANTPLWSCLISGYCAAALIKDGHDVHLMDAAGNGWDFKRTQDEILNADPEILCINTVFFWEHTPLFFNFLSNLRQKGFNGHINLFGFFPTLAWEIIFSLTKAVDSVALGECENTLAELAKHLETGKNWKHISGLAFHEKNSIQTSGHRSPASNLDDFAFPKRHNSKDTASVLASRGCYNQCSFCPVPSFYNQGPLWRGRTPENVFSELSILAKNGTEDIYFVDPNFIGPGSKGRQRAIELAQLIKPLKISFGMETRPNDLDAQTIEQLAQAGLKSLLIGIENVSFSVLNKLNKHSSINVSERAIKLCRAAGIDPEIGFLMFVPDSCIEDINQNFDFLLRNNLLNRLDKTANLLSHYQIVLYGTTGYRYFKKQKRLIKTDATGFQHEISYKDKRVEWMASVIVPFCHYILKEMGQKDSPLYWNKKNTARFADTNNLIVDIFKKTLEIIKNKTNLPNVESVKKNALNELKTITGI